MFNPYKNEDRKLEAFRIKAHLRSYVIDPSTINQDLLDIAILKLKKLPHEQRDPSAAIAVELVLNAYKLGYFRIEDLTEAGSQLVRFGKFKRVRLPPYKHLLGTYKRSYSFVQRLVLPRNKGVFKSNGEINRHIFT